MNEGGNEMSERSFLAGTIGGLTALLIVVIFITNPFSKVRIQRVESVKTVETKENIHVIETTDKLGSDLHGTLSILCDPQHGNLIYVVEINNQLTTTIVPGACK